MIDDHTTEARPVLSVRQLSKRFQGICALEDVSIDFLPGEIHVLFGENGAGKSTLIKLLSGVHQPDEGYVELRGVRVDVPDPATARKLGIATVFQDPALVPQLTVGANLELGREPGSFGFLRRAELRRCAREALQRLGCSIPADALVSSLGRADQQVLEIVRALQNDARLLILDEPTAALTDDESEKLFGIVKQLSAAGMAVIYITHRMQEIRRLGDRVSVLRDGKLVRTAPLSVLNDDELVRLMTGREVGAIFPTLSFTPDAPVLELDGVSGDGLRDVSLSVRAGEIVGLAGLVGGGKDAVGRVAFGVTRRSGGAIRLRGHQVPVRATPEQMIRRGAIYYPADRKRDALVASRSAAENVTLSALDSWTRRGLLRRGGERTQAREVMSALAVRPLDPDALPNTFSGGNQQKLVLGRGRTREYAVHIFDEPTAGVDVGARAEIYRHIADIAARGGAVLLISSDLPEVLNMSNRVYVVTEGRVVAELPRTQLTEENVLPFFFPQHRDTVAS